MTCHYSVLATGIAPDGALFAARATIATAPRVTVADVHAALASAAAVTWATWPEVEFAVDKLPAGSSRVFLGVHCPARHTSSFLALIEHATVFSDIPLART